MAHGGYQYGKPCTDHNTLSTQHDANQCQRSALMALLFPRAGWEEFGHCGPLGVGELFVSDSRGGRKVFGGLLANITFTLV